LAVKLEGEQGIVFGQVPFLGADSLAGIVAALSGAMPGD
jgi:hypothetical protein